MCEASHAGDWLARVRQSEGLELVHGVHRQG